MKILKVVTRAGKLGVMSCSDIFCWGFFFEATGDEIGLAGLPEEALRTISFFLVIPRVTVTVSDSLSYFLLFIFSGICLLIMSITDWLRRSAGDHGITIITTITTTTSCFILVLIIDQASSVFFSFPSFSSVEN